MKISIKLLKGEIFDIEAAESDLVSTLKEKIENERTELKSDRQKLIHAGKVLKDTTTVSEIGIQESDFLVCMVTKEVAKPKTTPIAPVPSDSSAGAVATAPVASLPVAAVTQPAAPSVNPEALSNLIAMGFPENETKAALVAAQNNADLAYEFLLTGIPSAQSQSPAISNTPTIAVSDLSNIQQLRSHPQFNMLKQLIQSNPTSLPQVLNLIGAQNPALLQSIHRDEREFLAMMNEPITSQPPAQAVTASPPSLMQGGAEPSTAQMMQVLQSMPPSQRSQFAQSMGMSGEQLNTFMQMISQLPPDQLNQMMMGQQQDVNPPGTITLTHEEMESVNRLMALGFSQQQAAQAYLACDKNETLAANFLFESGGFEDDFDDGNDDMHS